MIQIPNYPNYFATPDGHIFSNKFGSIVELTQGTNSDGYKYVSLNRKQFKVHRVIALTFIPNPNNYPVVCHKDDNPSNNCVDNLWWGTVQMNVADRVSKGRNKKGPNKKPWPSLTQGRLLR